VGKKEIVLLHRWGEKKGGEKTLPGEFLKQRKGMKREAKPTSLLAGLK